MAKVYVKLDQIRVSRETDYILHSLFVVLYNKLFFPGNSTIADQQPVKDIKELSAILQYFEFPLATFF